jgi:hypothetical protein
MVLLTVPTTLLCKELMHRAIKLRVQVLTHS